MESKLSGYQVLHLYLNPPPDMRGRSLRPILEGRKTDWYGFTVTELGNNSGRVIRTPRYKYIAYNGDSVEQLFDLQSDPGETKNLIDRSEYASVISEHKKLLVDWERRLEVAPDLPNSEAWWRS